MKRQARSQSHRNHPHHPSRVVFESQNGSVLRCATCGGMELRFGNAVIALIDDDLDQLQRAVATFDASSQGATGHPMEHALVYIGNSGNGYRFSHPQVSELHRLLVGAQLLLGMDGNPATADDANVD